ncbi:hypothetical protein QTP70_012920 [Hemibagrus guttatus]|uniref:Paired domain-containing protein n=1 Tax=Hemibagrus guttatus TaxID=175788 RepID=A0AAE0QAN5_9TELE|nr:hypothetical protein QTP70_012920 [Hemibagrus guttatus]
MYRKCRAVQEEVKMGRGSPIPPMLRPKIVEQYQKGVSQRNIAKSLKLSSSTVHNIIQRFRESGTISVRKGQGRKTILDARDLRALRRHCITYRNATVMEITTWAQEYFQKTLSVNTIHRAIRRCRLKLYRSEKKPYLNMIQKHRRFLWAKAHLKWTVAKWKTVLWSDQSKSEVLFGKLGRHVIRTKEDKDNPSCYQRSVQKPASLMIPKCQTTYKAVASLWDSKEVPSRRFCLRESEKHLKTSILEVDEQQQQTTHQVPLLSDSPKVDRAGSREQQSKQGCPDFPLPRHFLQLFWRDPEAFPEICELMYADVVHVSRRKHMLATPSSTRRELSKDGVLSFQCDHSLYPWSESGRLVVLTDAVDGSVWKVCDQETAVDRATWGQ